MQQWGCLFRVVAVAAIVGIIWGCGPQKAEQKGAASASAAGLKSGFTTGGRLRGAAVSGHRAARLSGWLVVVAAPSLCS